MWRPPINFISLHYAYIITVGVLGLIILYPYGNLRAVDAYFFGASASTESGLNTVDVKALKTYQQLYIYFAPILTNLGFINILVVVVRLHWFGKRLKETAPTLLRSNPNTYAGASKSRDHDMERQAGSRFEDNTSKSLPITAQGFSLSSEEKEPSDRNNAKTVDSRDQGATGPGHITFADVNASDHSSKSLYVPSPRERDRGHPLVEVDQENDEIQAVKTTDTDAISADTTRQRRKDRTLSLERVASSMFVVGAKSSPQEPQLRPSISLAQQEIPYLSSQAILGRNSQFHNLTAEDREILGGIEYRSLKLLLKIVIGYFFGLHLLGAICLVGWIQNANPKYREYLHECGQDSVWWAFYSAQTMVDNLGFTLTPDSMVTFQDAVFPLLIMSFLAYAGNTCYPCILRLVIWVMSKTFPKKSSLKEPLEFLLKHPRRCYTLLFPGKPTWVLFSILFAMNFIDVVLIIALDLDNPAVNNLPAGQRVVAAIFQAASARHTGTASFNLADVNPAVQFSLLVMMYIAIFPISISVRASNTYEERSLGIFPHDEEMDESKGTAYVMTHIRKQLSFDLWYIFLGIFCICAAESKRIMDDSEPAFAVFPIFFEVVSAYANVGLSLGYPTVLTSLSGQFTVFSKLVICAMMIRGRHRGLPYQLDRAILLPNEYEYGQGQVLDGDDAYESGRSMKSGRGDGQRISKMKRYHTR